MASTVDGSRGTEEFGPYVIFERLGLGGMATVHRAKKRGIEGFERMVALKRLLPHLAEDADFVKSFVREAKLASLLIHANIVQIYELGRVGPVYFISMEYVEGHDLRRILRQARRVAGIPPVPVVLTVLAEICEALDHAHTFTDEQGNAVGIVHRDVSPSNVIVSKTGHVKVIDFGIAKATSQQLRTQTGRVKGKLGYMSPEAALGRPLDSRSDIFSVGVLAHELLTARPLFASKNDFETLQKIQSGDVTPPSTVNPDCPPELDEVVLRALAKSTDDRYATSAEFRAALDGVGSRIGARHSSREVMEWMQWAFAQEPGPEFGGHSVSWPRAASGSNPRLPSPMGEPSVRTPLPRFSGATPVPRRHQTPTPVPLPAAVAATEEAAEIAWGRDAEGVPMLLDDVPDMATPGGAPTPANALAQGSLQGTGEATTPASSAATPALATGSTPAVPAAAADFGAGVVGRKSHMALWKWLAIGGGAVLALLLLIVLLGRGGDKDKDAPPPVRAASLKFVIQPEDATIEVGGKIEANKSPYEMTLDPGIYSVAIRREGYKSWVADMTVDEGERQTIRIALEKGGGNTARLSIRSTPDGLTVEIDGQPLAAKTPVDTEVPPGVHQIVVKDAAGGSWSHQLVAEVDTHYQFQAPVGGGAARGDPTREKAHADLRPGGRSGREGGSDSTGPLVTAPPGVSPSAVEAAGIPAPGPAGTTTTPGTTSPPATTTTPAVTQPAPTAPATTAPATTTTVTAPPTVTPISEPPKTTTTAPPAPRKAVNVPPTSVTKISGTLPALEVKRRAGATGDIIAKLCIDEKGGVTSVDVMRSAPEIKDAVQAAMRKWRYKPYYADGLATPACFAVTMKVAMED